MISDRASGVGYDVCYGTMKMAKTVIDWDGQDDGELLREFHGLPPGRYAIVPVNDARDAAPDDDRELTDEQIQGLNRSIERLERGEPGVPFEEALARIDVRIDAAAARRR